MDSFWKKVGYFLETFWFWILFGEILETFRRHFGIWIVFGDFFDSFWRLFGNFGDHLCTLVPIISLQLYNLFVQCSAVSPGAEQDPPMRAGSNLPS